MKISEIIPKDDYILFIKTEDGQTGMFNVKPYLESEAFRPLKDRVEFNKVHNGRYFIAWECGADLSADTIQARWKPDLQSNSQPIASADFQGSASLYPENR